MGGGSALPIITTRSPAIDAKLAWGDHNEIFGTHDFPDKRIWASGNGWVVHTALVHANSPSETPPYDEAFRHILAGGGLYIRLNEEYGRTIPTNRNDWVKWAEMAGEWLKALLAYVRDRLPNKHPATIACGLGNEMNAEGEWGGGEGNEITPELYADFFNVCYPIIKAKCPNVMLSAGAVAWYAPTKYKDGRYLTPRQWWQAMIARIKDLDAITLHTYSHSQNPASVTSDNKFGDWPMQDIHYDFQNYRDQMEAIPENWRFVPVYITETNGGADLSKNPAWQDVNTGWITEAYREIARWNSIADNQQIHMLALFCWSNRRVGSQEYGLNGKWQACGDMLNAQRVIDGRRFVPNWLPPYANRPYASQLGIGALKYSGDCGHACLWEVLKMLGLANGLTIDRLVDMVRQNAQGYSTGNDLVRLFGYFGVPAAYLYDQSPNSGDICLIDYSKISQRFDKNYTGLHWLTYLGEKDANLVVVNDPDYYGQGGRNREYYKSDFVASLTGWVVRVQR